MTSQATTETFHRETAAERRRLAALLRGIDPQDWGRPSLCDGWRVREVLAHQTMPFRYGLGRMVVGMVRARGRFDVFADRAARDDTARLADEELLSCLEANEGTRWNPPGGGAGGTLAHDVIHGLDMTEALGLPSPPPERIVLAIGDTASSRFSRQLRHFGVDLAGRRLVATDSPLVVGDGPDESELSTKDLLLVITARTALPPAAAPGR